MLQRLWGAAREGNIGRTSAVEDGQSANMGSEQERPCEERERLWADLRAMRREIDRLVAGQFDSSDRQRQIVTVLARIVAAEMDFRAADATTG